ncbi:Hypothetical predicted protein [Cloeon dipterum]|uniref:Uncharacterized protein n=1 Tax=Cloeon dipterum TaxID=197152 RepID=A0A8S1DRD4_9INSE|nr:Hypothetical predicted protein [Cloeon dipterum]
MNDEEKLELTKKKLLNISRRCSLVELSRRKIVKNLDFYKEHEEYGRRLKSLPVCLRDQVLRELTSLKFDGAFGDSKPNFEKKLQDFSFLLSSDTKEIDLDGLLSFCPQKYLRGQLWRVLQMIAAEAPNVQSLIINGRNSMANTYILLRNFSLYYTLDRAILESICGLSKLKRLEISIRLMRLCIEHLPKLRLLNPWDFNDFNIPDVFNILKLPSETSSLMNLGVYPTSVSIHQVFPEVRHLTIGWPYRSDTSESSIDTLLHFSKLESISVHPSLKLENILYQLLDRYGSNLRNLSIWSFKFELRMIDVMNRCKNLERLALHRASFFDQPLMPTQTFAELKELMWANPLFENSNYGQHLLHLLLAPKLEKVALILDGETCTDLDVLNEIANLVASGHILRELKSFIIYLDNLRHGQDGILRLFEAITRLVADASAFLPKCTLVVLKPYEEFCLAPIYNSQGEFLGFSYPGTVIDYDFREFGQPNLAKFLFACRAGRQL